MRSVSLDGLTFCLLVVFIALLFIFNNELSPAIASLNWLFGQVVDYVFDILQKIASVIS